MAKSPFLQVSKSLTGKKIENDKRIKAEHIDSTLIRLTCEKWWFKQMRDIQKRMVEHIAIACGEVRANAASYISNQSFPRMATATNARITITCVR
ncbi:replication endonuclease [Haemophilus influenzae]|nr:replication endonuclease [Haemophilus influenzae]